ncbi:protein-tyrosine-phosphatase [Sphingobacterium oryzagri]|uniref:Protein-tyrosine-phosphatase n=1 Tax=Sphingobacterium oryzagri TaxID=3025669 RepID=A0ABY7WEE8_9SPHI|nr:protein-tyrosine-phosphatase [Sphingobacterium sp. KACC 22765]WDF66896.1 protein-tyrosine-phosphatase [Sphingobacterium sp. KACC 22765]
MYAKLSDTIQQLQVDTAQMSERIVILKPLIEYIQRKYDEDQQININFICTHNSRRSHLSQIWAQTAATFYGIENVHCYSGGTEETALYGKVASTLSEQGFQFLQLSEGNNPIYAIKYDDNCAPLVGFSKKYDHSYNPISHFAAIMTCSQADGGCPFIAGAEKRIPITFEDPKISDNTPEQDKVYAKRSLEIGQEMFYVFSQISKKNDAAKVKIS